MADDIMLAVSKIGEVVSNEEVSAVMEKLSRKVTDVKELPEKIKRIANELRELNNVIQDFGTIDLGSNRVKGWIADVRKLANLVEDVMGKCSYEALRLKEEGFLHRHGFRGSRHIKVFNKIADEVVDIEEEIRHVKVLHTYWSNAVQFIKNDYTFIDRKQSGGCFPELVSDEDLVGIDDNRSKLTEWLNTDEQESTVISVVGMGGLGKTTLVKNVYDREKENFRGGHAWIVVSQSYDVVDLLAKLLTNIGHTLPVCVGAKPDVFELTETIQKTLRDKKCLIVLDDVWDIEAYNQMRSALQGVQGSRIMITTRKEDVAALAPRRRRFLLQPLGAAESFKLLCSRAFNNNFPDRKYPPELEKMAAAIVERCYGLPLAVVFSGSLLSAKEPTENAWNQVYNDLSSELRDSNHVQAILNRSYRDLPVDLRNCFLYCCLFAKDHLMLRENLVQLWVAEGFVMKKDSSTPEEVAEENLMELIGRNMLEVVERDELQRVSTCKMHDIVRDLALAIAKERFGFTTDQGDMMLMDRDVRRFSTCGWTDSNNTAPAGVKFPRLHTVMSIGSSSNILSSVLSGSSYLTVLELQDSPINHVPAFIGDLFNLRYIGLRRTKVQSLPDTIDKLSNLETLDLKHTRIEKLPPGIVKVVKLRHLFADRLADEMHVYFRYYIGVEAPKMISNIQELQTLETVHASKDLALHLRKMKNLQTVCIDNIDASNCEELFGALSDLPLLSILVLSARDEKETLDFHALKPISYRLYRLILRGGWADGTLKCPIFQGYGSNLRFLALSWCYLGSEDPLQLLAYVLPALTYLSLNRVSSANTLVLSTGCFCKLKTLVLKHMPHVNNLVIEDGAIPSIDAMYIMTLSGLEHVPRGIESLGSLRKLSLLDLHKDFKANWIVNRMYNKMMHVPELRL